MDERTRFGSWGEEQIIQYLKNRGFTFITRNFKTRRGEVDLIVAKDDLFAFVEVKTRNNPQFEVATVVTQSKQRKIIMACKEFLLKNQISEKVCRFDVAVVIVNSEKVTIEYIENAFYGE